MEWLLIHSRPCLGLVFGLIFSAGQLFQVGMAFPVPRWQLLVSLPFFVFFIYSRCVGPEGRVEGSQ